jgi:hypothetical protein
MNRKRSVERHKYPAFGFYLQIGTLSYTHNQKFRSNFISWRLHARVENNPDAYTFTACNKTFYNLFEVLAYNSVYSDTHFQKLI